MSSIYSDTHSGVKDNNWALHVVRNGWGWSEEDQRRARLMVADAYEASIGASKTSVDNLLRLHGNLHAAVMILLDSASSSAIHKMGSV